MGFDEGACRFVAVVEIGGAAEIKIDRYQHQSRAMRDRHGKGPEPQWCRSYPRQHPRMAPVDEPEAAEPDDQEARADLDLSSRWPTRSGPSAATRARDLLSISPAETASGHPIPGFTP